MVAGWAGGAPPPVALACPAAVEKAMGACLLCCPPALPLVCFYAPIPPTPFPAGRGGLKVFLCKGLRPLHPQGLTRTAQAFLVESGFRRGAQGGGRPPTLPCRNPAGGLPFWSPASPAFSFVSAPIPPPPFPAGRGRFKVYFAGGYRPRHPCNRVGCGTGFYCGKRVPAGASPLAGRGGGGVAMPGGGRRGVVACRPCRFGIRWGACLFGRLPALLL